MYRVIHVVGLMNKGGIETFVMNVLRHNESGCQMDVLCTMPGIGDYDEEIASLGSKVYHVSDSCHEEDGYLRFWKQYSDYRLWFSEHRYDAIHLHGSHAFDLYIAYCACKNAGNKNIVIHSHTTSGLHPHLNSLFSILLNRAKVKRVACSDAAGKWLFGKKGSWELIKNGIDLNQFMFSADNRKSVRLDLGINSTTKVIVHTGRFIPLKNQKFIVEVLAQLKASGSDYAVIFLGVGEELENVRAFSQELGVGNDVHFVGSVPDVEKYLSAADIFIMPSLYEGLPLACIEAQASGLRCFFSTGITPEVKVLKESAFFDLKAGAKKCAIMIDSSSAPYDRLSAASVVKTAGYEIRSIVDALVCLYKRPINEAEQL